VPPSNVPFLFRVPSSPSVALGEDGLPRVLVFPECHALLGTRGRPSSPSAFLPRVQHSGKIGFPECPIFGTRGRLWHSGNFGSPVVPAPSAGSTTAEARSLPPVAPSSGREDMHRGVSVVTNGGSELNSSSTSSWPTSRDHLATPTPSPFSSPTRRQDGAVGEPVPYVAEARGPAFCSHFCKPN
jgi:hypothetical protein